MTPFEKATQVIATLRPSQAWNHIAKSDRQFLLIGDSNHGDVRIIRAVTKTLPRLAKAGFKHLALEREEDEQDAAWRAFHGANTRQRRSKSDKRKLVDFFCGCYNAHVGEHEADILDAITAEFKLHTTARDAGIKPYPIRDMMNTSDFIDLHYSVPNASAYNSALDYFEEHRRWPVGITAKMLNAIKKADDRYDKYNMARDGSRMRQMRKIAGQDRAIIFYGAAHFRRSKTEGMDKHLPAGSAAYVMVGTRALLEADMRYDFRNHRGSIPDFVVTTDTKEAWVLPPAVRNGLWHG